MAAAPGTWAQARIAVGPALAELANPMLTTEQQGRLALAWMRVYLAGGAAGVELDDWRRALGYTSADWPAHRDTFAEALTEAGGKWTLGFMADEAVRQAAVSSEQRRKGQLRQAAASRGSQRVAEASPASASASTPEKQESLVLTPPPATSGEPRLERARETKDWTQAFEIYFWPEYRKWRKEGKAEALKAWLKITPKTQETFDAIDSGLRAQIADWKDKRTEEQYRPHAATWLNQRRWLDYREV